MGLNLSNCQIAQELNLAESDVQAMTEQLRTGITTQGQRIKGCGPIFRLINLNSWDAAPL
jgi:hypothetical protein